MTLLRNSFRAEIAGAYLLPEALKNARTQLEQSLISATDYLKVENDCIKQLIEKQKSLGLDFISDGCLRRKTGDYDFYSELGGIELKLIDEGNVLQPVEVLTPTLSVTGRISFNENNAIFEHFKFTKQCAGNDVVARQTIPAPAQLLSELLLNNESYKQFYSDRNQLVDDIAKAYRLTFERLYALGCRAIRLDDSTWGNLCDPYFQREGLLGGINIDTLTEDFVNITNKAIDGLPADMEIILHVRRNIIDTANCSADNYNAVASVLLPGVHVGSFMIDFGMSCRSGFQCLQYLPDGKKVILGLINAHCPEMENEDKVIAKIKEAAHYVPTKHMALSPCSGFLNDGTGDDRLTVFEEADQWRKIELIQSVARRINEE